MDTDSFYMALSDDIENLVSEKKWSKYLESKKHNTVRALMYFKPEYYGTEMIALNNKCYYVENACDGSSKSKVKGINTRPKKEAFLDVLYGREEPLFENKGFRIGKDGIYTYKQTKKGSIMLLYKKNSFKRWNPHKTLVVVTHTQRNKKKISLLHKTTCNSSLTKFLVGVLTFPSPFK